MLEYPEANLVPPEEFDDGAWEMDQEENLLAACVAPGKKAGGEKGASATAPAAFDPLKKYLAEIRHFPALSKEEEFRLAVLYQEKEDVGAAHRLVTAHLLLVVKIAMRYRRVHNAHLDLIQEGNVGLMEAIQHFDPYRKLRLSTYAAWWIRAYILKFIQDNRVYSDLSLPGLRRQETWGLTTIML